MLTVAEAREKLAALYSRRFDRWAVDGPPAPTADIPLHPPTEIMALHEPQRVSSWIAEWGAVHQKLMSGSAVVWETRRWPNAGLNSVAIRLVVQGPEDLAASSGRVPIGPPPAGVPSSSGRCWRSMSRRPGPRLSR